jgi:biotin-(acetyl-CoA carboxylase) ligase
MSLWLAYQLKTVLADFLGGSDILMVKWPNDVCKVSSDGVSKVGGMLLERVDGYLYCGVGINATAAPPLAIEPGDLPAGCFEMDGERVWERVQACLLRFAATLIQQSSEHCEATAVDAVRGVEADMLGSLNRVTWFQKEGGGLTPMVPLEIVIPSGGLRVKTQEGERLLLKGSITGSVCVSPSS